MTPHDTVGAPPRLQTPEYPNEPCDVALEERHEAGELRDAIDFRAGWEAAAAHASSDLWTIARHVATDSSATWPRYHDPSGECEQYGSHIHQPGFIVWAREADHA